MEINGINARQLTLTNSGKDCNIQNRPEKIYNYLKTLSGKINIAKPNRALSENTTAVNQAVNFTPPKDGLSLDIFLQPNNPGSLGDLNPGELAIEIDKPLKSLAETNPMGINELIATGESNFKGSPKTASIILKSASPNLRAQLTPGKNLV